MQHADAKSSTFHLRKKSKLARKDKGKESEIKL